MLANLATKDDIKEVLNFMKNVNTGVSIFKISWHTIAVVGGFISAVVAIVVFIKFVLVGIISWALSK